MGSCASVHKDLGFPKKLLLASPTKEKPVNGKGGSPVGDGFHVKCKPVEEQPAGFGPKSPEFANAGSKDEMFFDSRAWLDSDCEDDFYSVNGDFTPSRGSTPNYQPRTPTMTNSIFLPENFHDSKSAEPSPTGRKKLGDLLQETLQGEKRTNEQNGAEEKTNANGEANGNKDEQLLQSAAATQKPMSEASSACSNEPTPTRQAKSRKEKMWNTGRCCLPGFVHTLGFDERRQKMGPGPCAA